MKLKLFGITAAAMFAATLASAQDKKFTGYIIKTNTEIVEGVLLANGYSPEQVLAFVREDCASGEIGALQYLGKPYKKRGNIFQKFQTSCVSDQAHV